LNLTKRSRPATLKDLSAVVIIALTEAEKFPVRPDKKKIKQLVTESISTKSNFCWVSEEEGKVTGALVAISHQGLWFERKHLSILLLTTTTKGAGISMLREMLAWVKTSGAIKVVTTDFIVPPRMAVLLTRLGLRPTTTHTFFKGQ